MYRAVLYLSESTIDLSESTIDDKLKEKQLGVIKDIFINTNELHQITGVLASHGKYFFYILEGEPANVSFLLNKINNDSHNKNGVLIIDAHHDDRIYNDWELIESKSVKQTELLSYFLQENIDALPSLAQNHHDLIEEFVINIFS